MDKFGKTDLSEVCPKKHWQFCSNNSKRKIQVFDKILLQMGISWGLKRMLASPATDLLVCTLFLCYYNHNQNILNHLYSHSVIINIRYDLLPSSLL